MVVSVNQETAVKDLFSGVNSRGEEGRCCHAGFGAAVESIANYAVDYAEPGGTDVRPHIANAFSRHIGPRAVGVYQDGHGGICVPNVRQGYST